MAITDKFILASNGRMSQIQSYLGFGARMVTFRQVSTDGTGAGIIQVPAEHAEWQSGRLASGLYGGKVFDTRRECFTEMEALLSLTR